MTVELKRDDATIVLTDEEACHLAHTAHWTAGEHQDPRYYQDLTWEQRGQGQARWDAIAHLLHPDPYGARDEPIDDSLGLDEAGQP